MVGDEKLKLIYEAMKTDKQFARRFPPLAFKYLSKVSKVGPSSDGVGGFHPGLSMESWLTILQLSDSLQDSTSSGSYRSFFIDQVRSSADVEGVSKIPTILLSKRGDLLNECTPTFEDWDFLGNACAAVGILRKQKGDVPAGIVSFKKDRKENFLSLIVDYELMKKFIFVAKGDLPPDLYQILDGVPVARFNLGSVQPLIEGFNATQSQKFINYGRGIISYALGIPGNSGDFLVCFPTIHPVYNQPYKIQYIYEGGLLVKVDSLPAKESICPANRKLPLKTLKTSDFPEDNEDRIYKYLVELNDQQLDEIQKGKSVIDNNQVKICKIINEIYKYENINYRGCALSVSKIVIKIKIARKFWTQFDNDK